MHVHTYTCINISREIHRQREGHRQRDRVIALFISTTYQLKLSNVATGSHLDFNSFPQRQLKFLGFGVQCTLGHRKSYRFLNIFFVIHAEYFSKPGDTLLVLSGWRNATHTLVLSRFALSCMALTKPLRYTLMTVNKTGCNSLAQCLSGIPYVQNVKWIFIFIEKLWYVENCQQPRQSKHHARQNKTSRHLNRN